MAISDSQKIDYLFKKVGYSVTKTDTSSVKSPSNESIPSPLSIRGDVIWVDSQDIPTVIPTSNSSVVTVYADTLSSTIQTVNDSTASTNRTWKTNLTDWIEPSYGSTYQVKVYLATTGNTTPQTSGIQLFADGTGANDEWFFDYSSGVLNFIGTNLPTQTFTGKSIFISGARYVGQKGLDTFSNLTVTGNISAAEIYENGNRVLTSNSNIVITGDAIGSGTYNNVAVSLQTTGVVEGTYGGSLSSALIQVDSKGRVTNIANVTITQVGNLSVTDTTISSTGNIILTSGGAGTVQIPGTDAVGIPAGDNASRPNFPIIGHLRFNTDLNSLEYWNGIDWFSPDLATITSQIITPDGMTNTYTLDVESTEENVIVVINGTVQQPTTAYQVDGTAITFSEIPSTSDIIEIRSIQISTVVVQGLSYGNTKLTASPGNLTSTGNLITSVTNTVSLGDSTSQWKDLYLGGNVNIAGATISTNGNSLLFKPAGSPTPVNISTREIVFNVSGNLTIGAKSNRWYFTEETTIINVVAHVDTAPTGANVIFDVNKNDTTIFTIQANRPTILQNDFVDLSSTPNVTTLSAGDYIVVEVDQIGTSIPGANAIVRLVVL